MTKFFNSYASRPDDTAELKFQKKLVVIICSFLFLCGLAWTTLGILTTGWSFPAISAAVFALLVFSMIVISHQMKNHMIMVQGVFFGVMVVPILWQWTLVDLNSSGMVIAWSFLTPLGVLIFSSLRPAIVYMVLFIAAILVTIFIEPALVTPRPEVSKPVITLFYSMNLITSYSVIFATCAWFVHRLKKEKKHSDDLLLNILPHDVAEEMKKTGEAKAKAFTMVTVMFTDFKGFTDVSQKVSAELLVDEIHHCFSAFDNIIQKYKIEKIKTIGDAYLCASGLPVSNYTHAVDMINAALEMRNFMLERKLEKEAKGEIPFELRIGLHTGPVVAGIVGVRKFQYDIWGDTVNTAARMETNSEIGKINISQTTYELLKGKDGLTFESRGKIEAKGKGELEMFFVESTKKKKKSILKTS